MVMQALGAHDAKINMHTTMIQNMFEQGQRAMMQQYHPQHTVVDPVVALMGNQPTTALALAQSTMPIRTPAPTPTADRQVVPTLNITPDIPKDIVMTMVPKAGAIAPYKPKQSFKAKAKTGVVDDEGDTEKKQKNLVGETKRKKEVIDTTKKESAPIRTIKDGNSIKTVKPVVGGQLATLDKDTTKKHWNSSTLQHVTKQLQLRGAKINPKQFTGPNKLTKEDLLKLLYKRDKNIV